MSHWRPVIFLVSILLVPLAAAAAPAGKIVIAQGVDPTTLDMMNQQEQPASNVGAQMYDMLVQRDQSLKLVPSLAVELPKLVNPTTWEVKLRKGVKFHNGEDFTADSVKFSLERLINPANKLREFLERREIGGHGAPLRHRQMEELDRALDTAAVALVISTMIAVLGLHHVLVGGAAVAQVITEFDRRRHGVADLAEHIDGFSAEIDRAGVVIVFPGQHLLADIPLDRDPIVRQRRSDLRDLAGERLRSVPAADWAGQTAPCCCRLGAIGVGSADLEFDVAGMTPAFCSRSNRAQDSIAISA